MARMRHLEGLEHLALRMIALDDEAAHALSGSPILGNVRRLELVENGLSSRGIVALSKSFHLYRVEAFEISKNEITREAASALAASGWFGLQRELTLSDCALDDLALRMLFHEEASWQDLRSLNLSKNALSAEALIALCEHPIMRQLQALDLSENPGLDDQFSAYLERANHLSAVLRAKLESWIQIALFKKFSANLPARGLYQ